MASCLAASYEYYICSWNNMCSVASVVNFRFPPSTLCLCPFFENTSLSEGDEVMTITFALPSVLALIKHLQISMRHLKYCVTISDALLASMNQRFDGILQRVQVSKAPRLPDISSVPYGSTSSPRPSTPSSVCNGLKSQRVGVHYKHNVLHLHSSERSSSPITPEDRRLQVSCSLQQIQKYLDM